MILKGNFIIIILITIHCLIIGQCDNALHYPDMTILTSCGLNPITTTQWAGDYNTTKGYQDQAYLTFSSSVPTDYITLRNASNNSLIAHGITPISIVYNAATFDSIEMHINTNAACGTENINRSTAILVICGCNNAVHFPSGIVSLSPGLNTIASNQWAGDYNVTTNYIDGAIVTYASSVNTDFITLRQSSDNVILKSGLAPLLLVYDASMGNIEMHINTNASCGTENVNRTTTIDMQLANIYTGGNNDGFQNTMALNQNPLPNIYSGGNNDGFQNTVALNQNPLPNIYTGGYNDGFQNAIAFNQNPLPNIYAGGSNDGFQNTIVLNQNPLPNIYAGGNNDGFQNTIALNQNPLPNIYTGGNNDGFQNTKAFNQNPDCSDNIVRWGGNIDMDWANPNNWDCGILPNVNSIVILQSGLDNYPTVSNSYEIKKLQLKPLSSIKILQDVVLILNGN